MVDDDDDESHTMQSFRDVLRDGQAIPSLNRKLKNGS